MVTVAAPELSWIYDLYLLGQKIARNDDPAAARQHLLRHIVTAFDAASGSLAERDRDRDNLTIMAGIDIPVHVIGMQVPFDSGILGWVAANAAPLLLNGDVSSDPRFSGRLTKRENEAPRSSMCWPLQVEEQVVGVISVNRRPDQPAFDHDDLEKGRTIVRFIAIAVENARLHAQEAKYVAELKALIEKLEDTQSQLLQSEKMASIGQLAAGVAHEINNPVGYIGSNLATLQRYAEDIGALLDVYESLDAVVAQDAAAYERLAATKKRVDIGYLRDDLRALIDESQEGVGRVKRIVQDLKDFSHVDEAEWQEADLHKGLDSTLNIVNNEIKYKAEVVKEYGDLPPIQCMPSQLNQVFMNILVNAAHAIKERGVITVRTGVADGAWARVEISDTGSGIASEHVKRIFDPFFTTKPVGQGTGLGLSLAYGIVEKHGGRIEVESELGKGSTFRIYLPLRAAAPPLEAAAG